MGSWPGVLKRTVTMSYEPEVQVWSLSLQAVLQILDESLNLYGSQFSLLLSVQ